MCYHASKPEKAALRKILSQEIKIENYKPQYHVAGFSHPEMPVMLMEERDKVQPVVWGFIPENAGPDRATEFQNSAYSLNAKAETIFSQGLYKQAAKHRRCLVFVDGFYEWKHETIAGKLRKVPHYIQMPDHKPFAIGGLYSNWEDRSEGEIVRTHNVLTTPANELMTTIHNSKKRMPFIVQEKDWELWLDEGASEKDVRAIIKKFPEGILDAHEVNLKLGKGIETDVPESQQELR